LLRKGRKRSIKKVHSRFRLRNPGLKDKALAQRLVSHTGLAKGVSHVRMNTRVGSLLVLFDSDQTTPDTILKQISERSGINLKNWLVKKRGGSFFHRKRVMSKTVKLGLVAGLGGTLGTLAVSKKAHVLAGSLFLCFIPLHNYEHRKRLIRLQAGR